MKCLNDIYCGRYALVGIRDFVTCDHPESILFINDVPGISLKNAAAIVNDEQRTAVKLLNDKIILATKKVFHKFSGMVSGAFNFNSILESVEENDFSSITIPPDSLERGLKVSMWKSDVARIYIEELYVRVANSGIAYMKIFEMNGEDIVNTHVYRVSLLANTTNVVKIRERFESREIIVAFDQTNFTTFECDLGGSSSGCNTCGGSSSRSDLVVRGWNGSDEESVGFGVGIMATVQCYEEAILCQVLPRMAFMILYQAAIEIFAEHMASGRINAVVLFTKEAAKAEQEKAVHELQREERMFAKNIDKFLKHTRGECFVCKGTRSAYAIP